MQQLFHVTRKLVSAQTEIRGISVIDWQEKSWKRTTLLNDRAVKLSAAKAYVFSDSVLCMGRIPDTPVSAWKEKIEWFMNSLQCRELSGEPMEFEWVNFPGFTTLQVLADDWNKVWTWAIPRTNYLHVNVQRHWKERKRKQRNVYYEFQHCKKIRARTLEKRSGTEHIRTNRMENGFESLRTWCSTSVKADTPYSVDSVLWNKGELNSKGEGKLSIYFCGEDKTVEVTFRTIIFVNQVRIYGAVADICDESACRISNCSERTGELVA